MGSSPSFLDAAILPLIRGTRILDIGCGWGRWGCLLRTNYFEWGINNFPLVTGMDGDESCVNACKQLGVYDKVYCQMFPCVLKEKSFDTVLASEIIEHLTTDQVHLFLAECEKAARYRVIITTPNFQCIRGGSQGPLGYNELDHHQCFVSQTDLKKRGYTILGAGFSARSYLPARFLARFLKLLGFQDWKALSSLSIAFPKLAHTTIAFKDTENCPLPEVDHYRL
ncbi:MAG: class I SAM-dependent methyltransferase [Blastochloris sp.]|nr:class I SAM-dependent methyltransferase [Blastochloris sp.]